MDNLENSIATETYLQDNRVLLPSYCEPISYELEIIPDLVHFTFTGSVKILLEIKTSTNELKLHKQDLFVSFTSFTGKDGEMIKTTDINTNLKENTMTLKFSSELSVGKGILLIKYKGDINSDMVGFYRSQYERIDGVKNWMTSTQFEPIDARRAFPCWDEPALKAEFSLTLIIPKELKALSNMPEKTNMILKDNLTRKISFLTTPKMSTYLLCWCIGEFDVISDITNSGVICRVFTPPGRGKSGQFALDIAIRSLDVYNEFFDIAYPLPKLDMIAIMNFAAGAMENWGLITYRESDLLFDEKKGSYTQRQRVATVVVHEIAHQWFGNLVTMQWWNDLWLNEGFASWAENYILDILFPEWDMFTQFVANDQNLAMQLDSLRSSHPIQIPIKYAEEVGEVFDYISYNKGVSIVRIIYILLGKDYFQKGLQHYMNTYKYSNTNTNDLWLAWHDISNKPISNIMNTWTMQMGYPVLEIIHRTDTSITVVQKWFLADGSEPDDRLWSFPLGIIYDDSSDNTSHKSIQTPVIQLCSDRVFEITFPIKTQWIKLNAGQHVPLRIAYDEKGINSLLQAIKNGKLEPVDRVGLLQDAYALVKSGHSSMSFASLLNILLEYKNDTHLAIWENIETIFLGIRKVIIGSNDKKVFKNKDLLEKYNKFIYNFIQPIITRIGFEYQDRDDHLVIMLRKTIFNIMSIFCYNESIVKTHATKLWNIYFAPSNGSGKAYDSSAIPSDIKIAIFRIVLASCDNDIDANKFYDVLINHLSNVNTNIEKVDIYQSLGFSSSLAVKKKVLELSISDKVKMQDLSYPISSVSQSSREGIDMAWEFYKDNFDYIVSLIVKSPSIMEHVIIYSASGFSTLEKADEVENFFYTTSKKNPNVKEIKLPDSIRVISQTLEKIRNSARFMDLISNDLDKITPNF